MTYFKTGGVPNPDYDSEDINYVQQKTEFTEDVFVYGNLYAALGGDVQTFSTNGVERMRITKEGDVIFTSNNVSISGITTIATLNVSGNANLSGITTGTFVGDGSGLVGVTASGTGIVVKNSGSTVGTAGTVNFENNLDVVSFSGGSVTVRGSQNFSGIVTATGYDTTGVGDVSFGGEINLTNNGNKNRFIDCSLNDGEALHIRSTQGGDINHENMAVFTRGGACSFFDDGSSDYKFQTAAHGMNVNGDIHMGGTATTTNQNRKIFWTGFDKESTGDFTDTAEIRHTTNVHGISGSVLEIISQNDANDGIALNAGSGPISLVGNVRVYNGLRDKDGDLGNSGQVLSSTGSQTNWIDIAGSNVSQARTASDSSTSTQFNPVGYVDKLTLTVSNVQSTSKILLFFRMALGHNGSGTTLGRVTGPSLFGGQTQFETGSGVNTHGILFDTSNSTTREFKIQYADNGGVSSTISNTELFAVELKVSS